MATKKRTNVKTVEGLLKASLVLSRTVDFVLETHVVESAVPQALSPSKVQILRLLGRRGPQMPSQLAKFLGVTKSAVTQIVDSMVRDKLLSRRTAQADRREVNIQLTKKGRELYLNVTRAQRHCVRNMLRHVAEKDAERWVETLNEVSAALGRAEHAFMHFCAQCGAHKDGRCVLVDGPADCRMARSTKKTATRKKTTGRKKAASSKRVSKSASTKR